MSNATVIILTLFVVFSACNLYLLYAVYSAHEKRLYDIAKILLYHFEDIDKLKKAQREVNKITLGERE